MARALRRLSYYANARAPFEVNYYIIIIIRIG